MCQGDGGGQMDFKVRGRMRKGSLEYFALLPAQLLLYTIGVMSGDKGLRGQQQQLWWSMCMRLGEKGIMCLVAGATD